MLSQPTVSRHVYVTVRLALVVTNSCHRSSLSSSVVPQLLTPLAVLDGFLHNSLFKNSFSSRQVQYQAYLSIATLHGTL
jgi:hypothetical protein